jgi:uroporphyrinogen decarboxylase
MKAKMTPQERMHAVMMGQTPDRMPVVPFICGYAAQITGISIGDYYADGKKCFEAQFASMRLHGYDSTPTYGYASFGPMMFGGTIEFPYKEYTCAPYVAEHLVNRPEDVERLEVPTFKKGATGGYVEAEKVASLCIAHGMPATIQFGSPFSSASVIADTSTLLKWTHKKPKAAHLLMEKVTEMFCNAVDYFAGKYSPEMIIPLYAGPSEANTVISPSIFEEFVYPYMVKVHKKIQRAGMPAVLMHPCADQNLNIPYYVKMRQEFDWEGKYIWLLGPETPLADTIKAFGNHDVVCGNVDPIAFQVKSYDEVVQLCKENIEVGKASPSGFILSPGCEIPVDAPPANVMALMDAAEMYGQYE